LTPLNALINYVYEKKDVSSRVLFELQKGARFGIWSEEWERFRVADYEAWMEVEYKNQTGFMSMKLVHKLWLPRVRKHRSTTATIAYAIVAFGPLLVLLWKKELNIVIAFGWLFLTRLVYNKLTE
jgi:hypothetical protein